MEESKNDQRVVVADETGTRERREFNVPNGKQHC